MRSRLFSERTLDANDIEDEGELAITSLLLLLTYLNKPAALTLLSCNLIPSELSEKAYLLWVSLLLACPDEATERLSPAFLRGLIQHLRFTVQDSFNGFEPESRKPGQRKQLLLDLSEISS